MNFFDARRKRKLLAEIKNRRHAEDDLLSPALRADFDALISELEAAPAEKGVLQKIQEKFRNFPLPEKRGTMFALLDLIVVVGAVAFGLRGLYFQPFRIPTSSMQPTLFGIHYLDAKNGSNPFLEKLPSPLNKILFGMCDAKATADRDSTYYPGTERRESGLIFDRTAFELGGQRISLPGTPEQIAGYAKLQEGRNFSAGEKIADGYVSLGDHLFVERFSLYLSPPSRGDVMVFTTENLNYNGIPLLLTGGYYYIKRIAAIPGDTVKIENNQLYVKVPGSKIFQKIQEIEPRFEKIYSMKGGYHGHLSNMGGQPFAFGEEFTLAKDEYLMLGDNSQFSMDSRYFGPVNRKQFIGRAWLTFYPLSRRTGLVDSRPALDEPTGKANISTFPVMYRQ